MKRRTTRDGVEPAVAQAIRDLRENRFLRPEGFDVYALTKRGRELGLDWIARNRAPTRAGARRSAVNCRGFIRNQRIEHRDGVVNDRAVGALQ